MARKAAEEAWGRHFAYLVAAEPEKKAHCQAFFDNALQAAGAKHLTLNTADPGVLVERLEERPKAQASKGAGGQQEQGFDVTTGQELLRLCLLAEVAAGLLVPGHPLPPDTIEHAAALYAFIDEASTKLAHEIFCQPQFYNGCSSRSGGCYSSGDQRKLDKAVTGLMVAKPLNPAGGSKSDLAPHVDLQLAPPPQLLLELLLLQLEGDPQQQQQFQQRYRLDSSSSSSSSDGAAVDDESFRAGCKLCQLEKQQQQQQHASAGSSSSSSTAEQPGDAADPFMWRRLMWRLAGRIKPTAQRLFAADRGMCPHSDNTYMWHELISSLKLHLWVAPGDEAGLGRLLLCKPTLEAHLLAQPRSFFVRHFARAANLAFTQGYSSPAAPLLSHQVLLALSPLHRQQLPQPELAPLLPSSFGPVVAHVLSQQLRLVSELQFDRIAVCKDVADALQQRPSGGAVQSSLHDDLEGLFDPEFDHDCDCDLEPGLKRAANSPVMSAIRRQQEKLLLACAGTGSGGGLREILAAACGAADATSGVAAAALLAPAPAEVWLAPAAWCCVRSMLMRDDMCSECGEAPGKGAARLLELAGWQTVECGVQAADSCCADCGAFFFCCEQCAGKGWHWHRSLCKALTAVRKAHKQSDRLSGEYMSGKAMMLAAIAMHRTGMHEDAQRRMLPPFFDSFDLL
ncbi:hypothetical protein OEZ86_009086 [Tetradesmus obliquus]|nr:hypothetical protein OEZ86_009086 [Tetradesmus obliquus]